MKIQVIKNSGSHSLKLQKIK